VRCLPVVVVALLGVLAGCGEDRLLTAGSATYSGPLVVPRNQATPPRAGAAGGVVDCTTWGHGDYQDAEVYGDGATAGSPEGALDVAAGEGLFDGPRDGLVVVAQEDDRVLYVLEVDGVVKQAIVVRDGPATEGAGGDGWYVESWARCDAAELPRSWTDSLGLLIWEDAATGEQVPTSELEARRGPEHCDWQSTTFLSLHHALYLGRPTADLAQLAAEEWQPHAELPTDAVDTGYQRDGRHLWLSADRRRAFVGSRSDVELWPRATERAGCE
jgi:hypothetical protein